METGSQSRQTVGTLRYGKRPHGNAKPGGKTPREGTKPCCRLGEGFAGPAIVGNEVYILDRVDSERDVLRCLDFASGKELWSVSNDAPGDAGFNGSRGTPTVTDKYVYVVGLLGDMMCVDRKTHQIVWKKNLLKDFGGKKSAWGVAQHPLIYKDMVLVAPQGPEAFVVALNKDTGAEIWRSQGLGGAAHPGQAGRE